MSQNQYTVTYENNFVVDGGLVQVRLQKFVTDWQNDPPGLLKLVQDIFLDGVKHGLEISGHPVKDVKELPKPEENK